MIQSNACFFSSSYFMGDLWQCTTRHLPIGACHCQWGGLTYRNICNIHRGKHLAYSAMLRLWENQVPMPIGCSRRACYARLEGRKETGRKARKYMMMICFTHSAEGGTHYLMKGWVYCLESARNWESSSTCIGVGLIQLVRLTVKAGDYPLIGSHFHSCKRWVESVL